MHRSFIKFQFVVVALSIFCIKIDAFAVYSRSELHGATTQKMHHDCIDSRNISYVPTTLKLLLKISPLDSKDCRNEASRTIDLFRAVEGMKKILVPSILAFIITFSASAVDTSRDISGQDLSNGNYEQQDFSGVVAVGTNFQKSNLQGCNFNKAILINADLSGADVHGASFKDAVLDGTLMKDVNAVKTIFSASILDVGSLENADLTDSMWPSKLQIMICDMPTLKGTSPSGVDTRDSILCSL